MKAISWQRTKSKLFFVKNFLSARQSGWIERICFLVAIAIIFVQIPFHEPWQDEIQAWLISRDCSVPQIFYMMRFEGHFALWHLLLHPFARLGFPLITLNFISATLVGIAIYFLLFHSPFVRIVKLIILASAPLMYWYPVVSRVYALVPPLIFMLADAFPHRKAHPWQTGILLALLANTHAYMEGFVFAVFCILSYEFFMSDWKTLSLAKRRHRLGALLLVVAGVAVAFLQVAPAFAAVASEAPPRSCFELLANYRISYECFVTYYMFISNIVVRLLFSATFLGFFILLFRASFMGFLIAVIGTFWEFSFAALVYQINHAQKCYLILFMMIFATWVGTSNEKGQAMFQSSARSSRWLSAAIFLHCLFIIFSYHMNLLYIPYDLRYPFTLRKRETADFIKRSIPEDAHIYFFPSYLVNSAISVYLPNHILRRGDTLLPCTYLTLNRERNGSIHAEQISACAANSPNGRFYVLVPAASTDQLQAAAKEAGFVAIRLFQSTELNFPSLCGPPQFIYRLEPIE